MPSCPVQLGPCAQCDYHNVGGQRCYIRWERRIFRETARRLKRKLGIKASMADIMDGLASDTVSMHWSLDGEIGFPTTEAKLVRWITGQMKGMKKTEKEDAD